MLDLLESGENDFIMEALDAMPSFSDALQSNSILTKRIMKLKIEKGFAINQEEAQANA